MEANTSQQNGTDFESVQDGYTLDKQASCRNTIAQCLDNDHTQTERGDVIKFSYRSSSTGYSDISTVTGRIVDCHAHIIRIVRDSDNREMTIRPVEGDKKTEWHALTVRTNGRMVGAIEEDSLGDDGIYFLRPDYDHVEVESDGRQDDDTEPEHDDMDDPRIVVNDPSDPDEATDPFNAMDATARDLWVVELHNGQRFERPDTFRIAVDGSASVELNQECHHSFTVEDIARIEWHGAYRPEDYETVDKTTEGTTEVIPDGGTETTYTACREWNDLLSAATTHDGATVTLEYNSAYGSSSPVEYTGWIEASETKVRIHLNNDETRIIWYGQVSTPNENAENGTRHVGVQATVTFISPREIITDGGTA